MVIEAPKRTFQDWPVLVVEEPKKEEEEEEEDEEEDDEEDEEEEEGEEKKENLVTQILEASYAKLARRGGWTTGISSEEHPKLGMQYCSTGAIDSAIMEVIITDLGCKAQAFDLVSGAIKELFPAHIQQMGKGWNDRDSSSFIVSWNDWQAKKKSNVLKVFERAIELSKA